MADYTVGEDEDCMYVCIEAVMHIRMAEVPVVHGVHFEAAYSTWWRVRTYHCTALSSTCCRMRMTKLHNSLVTSVLTSLRMLPQGLL